MVQRDRARRTRCGFHTSDAARLGIELGDLLRVTTEIGYFVVPAWVTEGIRPGVVACSHHLGRWRVADDQGADRWSSALVCLEERGDGRWRMRRVKGVEPFASDDRDSGRVWWQSAGVHQNLTFAVHPDPISGAHAWHQNVRVTKAEPGDQEGERSGGYGTESRGVQGVARENATRAGAGRNATAVLAPPAAQARSGGVPDFPEVRLES